MNKEEIMKMMPSQLATNDLHLLQTMRVEVAKLYAAFGKHNTMTTVQLSQDVELIAQNLNREIKKDTSYTSLRTEEIQYLFSEVVKGTIAADKLQTVSLRSVYAWIREYMQHEERRKALQEYCTGIAQQGDVKALPVRVYTDEDYWKWLNKNYARFVEYKAAGKKQKGIFSKDAVPMCVRDYGGCLTAFLKQKGLLQDGKSLHEFFEECYEFGMDRIEF